jgi:hypothetical protein
MATAGSNMRSLRTWRVRLSKEQPSANLSYSMETINLSESSSLIKYVQISLCNNPKRDTHGISVKTKLHQNRTNGSRVIAWKLSTNRVQQPHSICTDLAVQQSQARYPWDKCAYRITSKSDQRKFWKLNSIDTMGVSVYELLWLKLLTIWLK